MNLFFKFFTIFLLSLSIFSSSFQKSKIMNIWVHGTNPAPEIFWMGKYSPFRPWLYATPGLSLATELPQNYYFHKLALACEQADNFEYCRDSFYTYGWPSTIPSSRVRKIEGQKLFEQLNGVIALCKHEYEHIKIRIFGFSHGGNLILNMISCLPFSADNVELEVVFLAIPVQELTRNLINNIWVSKAFSFYTDADWLQVLDLQKLQNTGQKVPWFSQKKFKDDDQVVQIKLTIDEKSFGHRDYRSINHHLPKMLSMIHDLCNDGAKSGHYTFNFLTKA